MTPLEGRSSENKNRVRCFGKNDLMPDVRDEKWDLVKLVCTQPFSKYVQYGLSLVKIYTNEPMPVEPTHTLTETKTDSPKAKVNCQEVLKLPENNVFSQFRFRQDSSDSDKEIETSSSLFSKWKQMKKDDFSHNKGLSCKFVEEILFYFTFRLIHVILSIAAATIRRASASETELKNCSTFNKTIESPKPSAKHKNNQTNNDKTPDRTKGENRNRDSLMYDDEDVNTSNPRLEQVISKDKERIAREKEEYASKKKDAGNKKPSGREEKSRKKMEASSSRYNIFLDMDAKAGSDSSQNKDKCEKDMADEDKAVDDTANKNKPDKDIQSMLMTSPDSSQSTTSPSKNIATPKVVKKRRSSSLDRSEETPNKRNKPLPSPAPSPVTAATFSPAPSQSSSEVASTPPSSSPPNKQQIPFHKLLAGVTFVISGIQVNIEHFRANYNCYNSSCLPAFRIQIEQQYEMKASAWALNIDQIGMIAVHI